MSSIIYCACKWNCFTSSKQRFCQMLKICLCLFFVPNTLCSAKFHYDRCRRVRLRTSVLWKFFLNQFIHVVCVSALYHILIKLFLIWSGGRRREMHIGLARLCVCESVCISLPTFPHYCADPDETLGNGRECPLVVPILGGFAIGSRVLLLWQHTRKRNVTECLYSLYAWFCNYYCRQRDSYKMFRVYMHSCATEICIG